MPRVEESGSVDQFSESGCAERVQPVGAVQSDDTSGIAEAHLNRGEVHVPNPTLAASVRQGRQRDLTQASEEPLRSQLRRQGSSARIPGVPGRLSAPELSRDCDAAQMSNWAALGLISHERFCKCLL